MSKITKIALTILGFSILFVALVTIMASIVKINTKELGLEETKILAASGNVQTSGSVITKGAHETAGYNKNGSFYYEATVETFNKVYCPSIDGVQLYCIEKGNNLQFNKYSVDYINSLNGQRISTSATNKHAAKPANRYSNTYYVCAGKHTNLGDVAAYIVTTPSNITAPESGTYTYQNVKTNFAKGENISEEVRQVAMWLNSNTNVGESFSASGAKFSYEDIAQRVSDEADDYAKYENNLNSTNNKIKETSEREVQINVNQKEQYLIIGPYKMDYVEGSTGTVTFAGISNMKVEGYNDKNKQVYIKDLEIIEFIQNGRKTKFKYFTPSQADGYVDRKAQAYPKSGEEFYLKVKNPNQGKTKAEDVVKYLNIVAEYSYMTASGTQCELEGHQKVAKPILIDEKDSARNKYGRWTCTKTFVWSVQENPLPQQVMIDAWGRRTLQKVTIELTGPRKNSPDTEEPPLLLDITMNLGGYVWEDSLTGKMSERDGVNGKLVNLDSADKMIPNVKVTLYECEVDKNGNVTYKNGKPVGKIADLLSTADREAFTGEEMNYRINPTVTNENGYYEFHGLNSSNKYYVVFEYNGQIYMPTEYLAVGKNEENIIQKNSVQEMVNAGLYNTDTWRITSKSTEFNTNENSHNGFISRNEYDEQFAEIGSSPKNYETSNSLKINDLYSENGRYYNETFSMYDLMGFELNQDGKYERTGARLIDGYYDIDNDGNVVETENFVEGVISKKIKEFMEANKEYPNDKEMFAIYQSIAGESSKDSNERNIVWKKLQFIEDCKIGAHTASPFQNQNVDLYPVYDDFTIDEKQMVIPGEGTKPPIYDGQYFVNLGLVLRANNDMALHKDIFRAVTKVNGKTEVYKYNKRQEEEKEEDYWDIQLRMKEYGMYYQPEYNRTLYPAEYNYRQENTNLSGKTNLELYITYKITIRNQSQGIMDAITEVVDYYDRDYEYREDLSWVMYKDDAFSEDEEEDKKIAIPAKQYYNMMDKLDVSQIQYARNIKSSETSRYGEGTHQNVTEEYQDVYVRGLEEKQLVTGESAYIYLTFKVKSDSEGPVILDSEDSPKQNYAEINGYTNYYANGVKLPNKVEVRNDKIYSNGKQIRNSRIAGLIDVDSTPGNLKLEELKGEKYERNFEDDTDRAKNIRVTLLQEAIRKLNGIVWEDERTNKVENSIIGDGRRTNGEIGINGVTVQLVEKLEDGREFVWQEITSGTGKGKIRNLKTGEIEEYTQDGNSLFDVKEDGYYEFSEFIPGNYFVRFVYGNTTDAVLTVNDGGKNAVSYNGQDFKSTLYQQNENLTNYNEENQIYNIEVADKLSSENTYLSYAKDLWQERTAESMEMGSEGYIKTSYRGRQEVNNYSNNEVTNHKAEVLASPYITPKYNGVEYTLEERSGLIAELIQNTYMIAETGVIVTEFEYNRTDTDGINSQSNGADKYLYGNDKNGVYTIGNVYFGLTERPKAQLEISKKVTNFQIRLANGNMLFDTSEVANNLSKIQSKEYNLLSKISNNKYNEYYKESKTDKNYHRYSYRNEITSLIEGLYKNGQNGLIQAYMDEELMHGANVKIDYELKVKNVGETDYEGQDFYYNGTGTGTIATTTANTVVDYVANNLQYREADNEGWVVAKVEELTNSSASTGGNTNPDGDLSIDENNNTDGILTISRTSNTDGNLSIEETPEKLNSRLVNAKLTENIAKHNTIITTNKLSKALKPNEEIKTALTLSQSITPQNKADDLTYENIAEIVKTSNSVGRRMAFSVVGNQNPASDPAEVDSATAETVKILPPFGAIFLYIGLGAIAVMLLIGGVIFIKKKVL